MFSKFIQSLWKWLANMGLLVTDSHEMRVADGLRTWGAAHDGLALSVAPIDNDLSIALKNLGDTDRTIHIADWMVFYNVVTDVPVSGYGELLLKAAAGKPRLQVTIHAGKFVETDLPMERLYSFEPNRKYSLVVECPLGLKSNTVEIVL